MNKITSEQQCIDCGCCGYDSCKEMVKAIYNGINRKENCIYYIKSVVENERDEISKLREMEKENQIKKDEMIAEIVKQFESIGSGIAELSKANDTSAGEATDISKMVSEISETDKSGYQRRRKRTGTQYPQRRPAPSDEIAENLGLLQHLHSWQ